MKLNATLYDFQEEGVEFSLQKAYSINAFTMGLGKTLVAIASIEKSRVKRALIVAPAFLVPNWKAEIAKFTGKDCQDAWSSKKTKYYITSYGSLKRSAERFKDVDFVVADECHYLKNPGAKRTKLFHQLLYEAQPTFFLGMSGTPIKNRVPEMYSLLKLVSYGGKFPAMELFKSQWNFNMKFCKQYQVNIGGRSITKWEGVKNVQALKDLIAPIYLRKRTEDVLTLPPQVRNDLLMAEHDRNDKLLADTWKSYTGKKTTSLASTKAVNALSKTHYTIKFVEETLDEAGQYVVFSDHVQAAGDIYQHFLLAGVKTSIVTGATPAPQRQDAVNRINNGELQILVATIQALSTGVNITGCNHMVFNDYPWVMSDLEQAEKRIHRIGQTGTCFYTFILASQIDKMILKKLEGKRKLVELMENT